MKKCVCDISNTFKLELNPRPVQGNFHEAHILKKGGKKVERTNRKQYSSLF
jgi:hypothetical protein